MSSDDKVTSNSEVQVIRIRDHPSSAELSEVHDQLLAEFADVFNDTP